MNLTLPSVYAGAVIHASATPPSMDIGVDVIRDWHVNDRGWSDIGYHIIIRRNGKIEHGRPFGRQGAHTGGYNRVNGKITLGICMIGGIDSDGNVQTNFTNNQWRTLYRVLLEFHKKNPSGFIIGHNEAPGHESRGCPCFDSHEYARIFFEKTEKAVPPSLPDNFMDAVDTGEEIEEPWEDVLNRAVLMQDQ